MNGTIARLLGAVAVASTLILGGCVADAASEEDGAVAPADLARPAARVVQSEPASIASTSPGRRLDSATAQVVALDPTVAVPPTLDVVTEDPGDDGPGSEPEPSPWRPPSPPHG
jgi:hypothetical protein